MTRESRILARRLGGCLAMFALCTVALAGDAAPGEPALRLEVVEHLVRRAVNDNVDPADVVLSWADRHPGNVVMDVPLRQRQSVLDRALQSGRPEAVAWASLSMVRDVHLVPSRRKLLSLCRGSGAIHLGWERRVLLASLLRLGPDAHPALAGIAAQLTRRARRASDVVWAVRRASSDGRVAARARTQFLFSLLDMVPTERGLFPARRRKEKSWRRIGARDQVLDALLVAISKLPPGTRAGFSAALGLRAGVVGAEAHPTLWVLAQLGMGWLKGATALRSTLRSSGMVGYVELVEGWPSGVPMDSEFRRVLQDRLTSEPLQGPITWTLLNALHRQRDEPGEWGELSVAVSSHLKASLHPELQYLIVAKWLHVQRETGVPLHAEVMLWVDRNR